MEILKCNLFDGQPYIEEKDGKYHVLQGCMTANDVAQMIYQYRKKHGESK